MMLHPLLHQPLVAGRGLLRNCQMYDQSATLQETSDDEETVSEEDTQPTTVPLFAAVPFTRYYICNFQPSSLATWHEPRDQFQRSYNFGASQSLSGSTVAIRKRSMHQLLDAGFSGKLDEVLSAVLKVDSHVARELKWRGFADSSRRNQT